MSQFYSELINEGDKFTIWVYKSNFYLKMSLAAIKKKKVAIMRYLCICGYITS